MNGEYESEVFQKIRDQEHQNKLQRQRLARVRVWQLFRKLKEINKDLAQHDVAFIEGRSKADVKEHCIILGQPDIPDGGCNIVVYDGQFFQALGRKRARQIPGDAGTELNNKVTGMGLGEAVSKQLGAEVDEAVELIVRALVSTGGLPLPNCTLDLGDYDAKPPPKRPGFSNMALLFLAGGLFAIVVMVYLMMP
jgi:hypothetical protein